MKRSALISDILFSFFVANLTTLFLFRYLKIRLSLAIILAGLCGLLFAAATAAWLQSKRKSVFLKRSDEAQKEKLLFHLAYLSDEAKTDFFLKRLQDDASQSKRFGKLRLYTSEQFYWLRFTFSPVTADEIFSFNRWKTDKEKVLLCNKIEDNAYALAQRFQIRVVTGNEVYAMLKERNALPKSYSEEETAEIKRQRRLRLWFSRKNAKPFLISAALTLATALVSPFPKYYLIFGFGLLTVSVFIRIFGYK